MVNTILIFCFCFFVQVNSAPKFTNDFELSVIHLNDFHARFEETDLNSGSCKGVNCIGGFSRVYSKVQELVKTKTNPIFLNAGDNFQGTPWYNIYRWNVTQHFLNKLPTDAYTLGNHEFDNKIAGVVPFIKALNAPTVVANINDTLEPEIQRTFKKSLIIERSGRKIGIIGVIAKNTYELSSTENLIFTDEVEAINKEATKLKEVEKCNIIIVLSHCGLDVDKHIAKTVTPYVNLIVGGHSHTFLYSGDPPGKDLPEGPYPVVINRENEKKILIVQASAYTKYLGLLVVWFNDKNEIVSWAGNPIYLDSTVKQDPYINEEIKIWKAAVDEYSNRIIGKTNVILTKNSCSKSECNLGNFITDAMIEHYIPKAEPDAWSYSAIAIYNSGGMRTTLDKGNITYGDLITTSPFEGTIDSGELTGAQIKEILEFSVNDTVFGTSFMQFLQFSGMKVVFDLKKPIGSRVVSLKIKCRVCEIPTFEEYNSTADYRILLNSFLAKGGDGYHIIKENLKNAITGEHDSVILENYIRKMSPIITGLEERITVSY